MQRTFFLRFFLLSVSFVKHINSVTTFLSKSKRKNNFGEESVICEKISLEKISIHSFFVKYNAFFTPIGPAGEHANEFSKHIRLTKRWQPLNFCYLAKRHFSQAAEILDYAVFKKCNKKVKWKMLRGWMESELRPLRLSSSVKLSENNLDVKTTFGILTGRLIDLPWFLFYYQ